MTQHLRDSMRYLYKCPDTIYDELLLTAKGAECKWLEDRTTKMKQATLSEDTGRKEWEEIKVWLDKLAETVKVASFQKPISTPSNLHQNSPRKPGKGPAITSAGPFQNGRKPLQCYKLGHVMRECPTQENLDWRELSQAGSPPEETGPELTSSSTQ